MNNNGPTNDEQLGASLIIAGSLTPLHPGAGRAPGVVDLPVIRDPFGLPYIPGSSLKGSLKSLAALKNKHCIMETSRENQAQGEIDCNRNGQCGEICKLFGREPHVGKEELSSSVSFTDLSLLLVPIPSPDKGVVFATSPLLISRAESLISHLETNQQGGDLIQRFKNMVETLGEPARTANQSCRENPCILTSFELGASTNGTITLFTDNYPALADRCIDCKSIRDAIEAISPHMPMYSIYNDIENRFVIVPDALFPLLVDRALIRQTRIRLNRFTKTVRKGALWTEEYIPQGTLFIGALFYNTPRPEYRSAQRAREALLGVLGLNQGQNQQDNPAQIDVMLGGKETVGKGLVRLLLDGP